MFHSLVFMGRNPWTHILIMLIFIDFLTGLSKAYLWKVADSGIGLKGFVKHALTFLLYFLLGAFCHYVQNFGMGQLFIGYICLNYVLSIIENIGVMGIKTPAFIKIKVQEEIKKYETKIEKEKKQ